MTNRCGPNVKHTGNEERERTWAVHLFLAISLAALINGASVRRGSESLKKGCYVYKNKSIKFSLEAEMAAGLTHL